MKQYFLYFIFFIFITSCKNDTEKQPIKKTLSIAEKIANAHGISKWNTVNQIDFTFNVDKDSTHFERHWSWQPKTNNVTLITGKDTINYNRSKIDSLSLRADQGFINDKFWLLAPFQLVWDSGTTISEATKEKAPISDTVLNKITLTYSNEGGYTPGDAYDFYYDKNYIIKEWVFRKGNTEKPSMITTFENHKDFNGITIAKDHKKAEGNWNLSFSNIIIKTQN